MDIVDELLESIYMYIRDRYKSAGANFLLHLYNNVDARLTSSFTSQIERSLAMARPRDRTSDEAMINPLLPCCCDETIESLYWDLNTPQKYWSQFGFGKTTLKSCVRIDYHHILQLYICFSRILGEGICSYCFFRSSIKCFMDGKGRGRGCQKHVVRVWRRAWQSSLSRCMPSCAKVFHSLDAW